MKHDQPIVARVGRDSDDLGETPSSPDLSSRFPTTHTRLSGEPSAHEHQRPPHSPLLTNACLKERSGFDGVSPYRDCFVRGRSLSQVVDLPFVEMWPTRSRVSNTSPLRQGGAWWR